MGGGFCAGRRSGSAHAGFCVAHGALPHFLLGHVAVRSRAAISRPQRNGLGELDGGNSPPRGRGALTAGHVPAAKILSERALAPYYKLFLISRTPWPKCRRSRVLSVTPSA